MEKSVAIAILCLFRTGSKLLNRVLVACGMKNCNEELGYGHGDINGAGNCLFNGFPIENPSEIVTNALKYFKEVAESRGWEYYGVKIDHVLQSDCWEGVGKPFLTHWPDARYVISIRHPAGVIRSFEKIKRDTPDQHPGFTVEDIVDAYLSTYDATKYLIDKKDALVVVYPDSHADGSIKEVVSQLGLTWTKEAGALFDLATLDEPYKDMNETSGYLKAVKMFEEFKKYAVRSKPASSSTYKADPKTQTDFTGKTDKGPFRPGPTGAGKGEKDVRPVRSDKQGKKSPKKH